MAKKRNLYMVDGKKVPSVTGITNILNKPQLMFWAVNKAIDHLEGALVKKKVWKQVEALALLQDARYAHVQAKNTAGEFGSRIHAIIEAHIGGQTLSITDDREKTALENFQKVTAGWSWGGSEIDGVNAEVKYGGTADAVAIVDGNMTLVDFKTSSGIYPEHEVQLCAYLHMTPFDEKYHGVWLNITHCKIVHLDKETLGWEVLDREVQQHWPTFLAMRQVYDWVQDHSS